MSRRSAACAIVAFAGLIAGAAVAVGAARPDGALDAGGAREASDGPDASDASSPPAAPRLVLTTSGAAPFVAISRGRAFALVGHYVYELRAGGRAELVGGPAAYAAFVAPGAERAGSSDDLGLFGVDLAPFVPNDVVLRAPDGAPEGSPDEIVALSDDPKRAFAFRGGAWTPVTRPAVSGSPDRRSWFPKEAPQGLVLPPGIYADEELLLPSGDRLVLGSELSSVKTTSFVFPRSGASRVIQIGHDDGMCHLVRAMEGATPHVSCHKGGRPERTFHRFDGERWHKVAEERGASAAAVDGHDAIWIAHQRSAVDAGTDESLVVSALRTPAVEVWDGLAAPPLPGGHAYRVDEEAVMSDEHLASLTRLDLEEHPSLPFVDVGQLIPMDDGSAWVATGGGWVSGLYYLGREGGPVALPVSAGSIADQRVEIANAVGVRPWTDRCPHLLVVAARERDGALDTSVFARGVEIREQAKKTWASARARGPARAEAPRLALVEGRSEGRRVAGVLVWRGDLAALQEHVDVVARGLADALVEGPQTARTILCTPPILTRHEALAFD